MSGVPGTGVAAGVAQTTLQAQQLARQRDKLVRDAKRLAQDQLEIQRVRLEGLEEIDAAEHASSVRIDNQVPQHERRELLEVRRRRHPRDDALTLPGPLPLRVDTSALTAPRDAPPSSPIAAAYQHQRPRHRLDLEG